MLVGAGFVFGAPGAGAYARLLSELGAHEARGGFGLIGAMLNLGVTSVTVATAIAMVPAASVCAAAQVHYRARG